MAITPPIHTRGEKTTDSWITPKWLIQQLGEFDLDPCACEPQPWACANRQYTESDNGLMLPWEGRVWCNPPYGKEMIYWLERMALHNNGIALVFARTETQAFFRFVWPKASRLLFIRKRLTFAYPDGSLPRHGANSGGPSVLIAYGAEMAKRLDAVCDLGAVVTVANP